MDRRSWLLFSAVSVLWGLPYLFIKIAITDLSPTFVVFGRTAIAALVLLPLASRPRGQSAQTRRGLLPRLRGHLRFVVILSFVHIVVPFLLISYGELYITSSLAGLIIAIEPVIIGLMLVRSEPFTPVRVLGLVLGFGGVAALTGVELGGGGRGLLGAVMVLLATASYALATILVQRRGSAIPPAALTAGTQVSSALILVPFAAFALPTGHVRVSSWSALVVLGLFCSAAALLAFYALIGAVGPNRAGLVTYVNPVVAVTLGVAVLHEPLRPGMLVGSVLILAGCWLSTRPVRPAVAEPAGSLARTS